MSHLDWVFPSEFFTKVQMLLSFFMPRMPVSNARHSTIRIEEVRKEEGAGFSTMQYWTQKVELILHPPTASFELMKLTRERRERKDVLEQFFQFSTPSVLVRIMLLQDKFRGSIDQFSSGNSTAKPKAQSSILFSAGEPNPIRNGGNAATQLDYDYDALIDISFKRLRCGEASWQKAYLAFTVAANSSKQMCMTKTGCSLHAHISTGLHDTPSDTLRIFTKPKQTKTGPQKQGDKWLVWLV